MGGRGRGGGTFCTGGVCVDTVVVVGEGICVGGSTSSGIGTGTGIGVSVVVEMDWNGKICSWNTTSRLVKTSPV